jgi:hypothetical protein
LHEHAVKTGNNEQIIYHDYISLSMQHTSQVLMIRPVMFDYNAETAVNNHFQVKSPDTGVQEKAAAEFDGLIGVLRANGVDVTVVDDSPQPHTPDSVFPNNWVSFHDDGSLILYPMFAENRRLERKQEVIDAVKQKFTVNEIIDFSDYEASQYFLEGTGSMVLDRDNKIAYACLSPRTNHTVLDRFCSKKNYRPVVFNAVDKSGLVIYHTNVMMCVADTYVVICLDSIVDSKEKERVLNTLIETGKEIIEISIDQVEHFAGNMLQVHNNMGERLLVMSSQAYKSLTEQQLNAISAHNRVLHADITTIETNGGGSARCMVAEVFLPVKPGIA